MKKIVYKDILSLINGLSSVQAGAALRKKGVLTFNSIAVVGSSCAGKTTMLRKIKGSSLSKTAQISLPVRYTTRPGRMNDVPGENCHLSRAAFAKKIRRGEIVFYWKKRMDARFEELFGFGPPVPGIIQVYSGNNGLLFNRKTVHPKSVLNTTLFIGIYAPDEIRRKRLLQRSPDLASNKPAELKYRLEDGAEKVLSRVHIVINNHGRFMRRSGQDMVKLLTRIIRGHNT
jgi:ribose 1,5-bisphosphokinase PhnN